MRFKVKKNPVLVLIILVLIPGIFSIPIASIIEDEAILFSCILFVFLLPLIIFFISALFNSYHEITDTEFRSVFGFIKINIPLNEIIKVSFSNNPVSSPAWTFKRLKIEYRKYDFVLLSLPREEEFFLQTMMTRCPSAVVISRKAEIISTKLQKENQDEDRGHF
ncbi:PH domain-containing protein [Bacillus sp. EAC]|uniref:PH domain-containing protein n=1 Tax=Bacillus sp. EAC TaxID=1978338 RepID=UPI000B43F724|nr:PH domain-containing protein [Bacillus sp. EAC]